MAKYKLTESDKSLAFKNNSENRCAGCGVFLKFEDVVKKYFGFEWCFNCFNRRMFGYPMRVYELRSSFGVNKLKVDKPLQTIVK